jgi:LysM repeat protein
MLEQKNRGRARVRIAVFVIISIHVVGLMGLLMLGCRKPAETDQAMNADTNQPAPPTMDTSTNISMVDTNIPMAPTNPAPPMVDNAVPPVMAGGQDYAIARGDTLSTIAHKFHVTVKAIQDANPNVQPTKLQIGQKLHIPAPTTSATTGAAPTDMGAAAGNGDQVYTVKSGDNLIGIAKQYGTTVKAIRAENNLPTDRIRVGQKLKIPKGSTPAAPAADATPSMPPPAAR